MEKSPFSSLGVNGNEFVAYAPSASYLWATFPRECLLSPVTT